MKNSKSPFKHVIENNVLIRRNIVTGDTQKINLTDNFETVCEYINLQDSQLWGLRKEYSELDNKFQNFKNEIKTLLRKQS